MLHFCAYSALMTYREPSKPVRQTPPPHANGVIVLTYHDSLIRHKGIEYVGIAEDTNDKPYRWYVASAGTPVGFWLHHKFNRMVRRHRRLEKLAEENKARAAEILAKRTRLRARAKLLNPCTCTWCESGVDFKSEER